MRKSINIKIGGHAGEGIKSVGLVLSKTFVRAGFFAFDYTEYPSLIRGGHNTYQTHISGSQVFSQVQNIDILIALNRETIDKHQAELTDQSLIIYDPKEFSLTDLKKLKGNYLAIPLIELAVKAGGQPVMANNVALGAVMFFTKGPIEILSQIIAEVFADKGPKIIEPNKRAAQAGFIFAQNNFKDKSVVLDSPTQKEEKILLTGNEAIGLGSIAAGMKFYAAYPMTPATSILHFLASKAKQYNLLVKHAEDEISVINMALGASFAGARSMVATSGGGFCLMSEALGMAGIMELPIVIVEGMRSGPSSGMPTWHDQGDLLFMIHASHGEFPRMVLAPGDPQEAFDLTRQAFYFAEKFQIPVIILTDKYLAESPSSIKVSQNIWQNERYSFMTEFKDSDYQRYLPTADGISPRSIPGQENLVYLSNSYEHDNYGFATEEVEIRNKMVNKRNLKFDTLSKEAESVPLPIYGDLNSETAVISWGSNKGPILQALQTSDRKFSFLHLNRLWPFPKKQMIDFLVHKSRLIDIECNSTAQLASLVREQTGVDIKQRLLKYDGRPFYPEEIKEKIDSL